MFFSEMQTNMDIPVAEQFMEAAVSYQLVISEDLVIEIENAYAPADAERHILICLDFCAQ